MNRKYLSFVFLTGGTVHMICRNKERGEAAQKEIQEASGNQVCLDQLLNLGFIIHLNLLYEYFARQGHKKTCGRGFKVRSKY